MPTVHQRQPHARRAAPERVWRTVGDPRHLARWWPKVQRVEGAEGEHFTEVLQTDRGRPVRADWTITESAEAQRLVCEQSGRGRRSRAFWRSATREIVLQPAGDTATVVTITLRRTMRGLARASALMMRPRHGAPARRGARQPRAAARRGAGRLVTARDMRWWGWGEDAHAGEPPEHAVRVARAAPGRAARRAARAGARSRTCGCRSRGWPRRAAALAAIAGEARRARRPRAARAALRRPRLSGPRAPARGRGRAGARRRRAARPTTTQVRAVLEPARRPASRSSRSAAARASSAASSRCAARTRPSSRSTWARMARLVDLDERSRLATFEPGLRGPEVERALRGRGLTLGHFPQSFEYATVGGWVATRSAGQASTGYGRIDELVDGITLAAPAGDVDLLARPASAAGPDLRELVVGSEGTLGVVTACTLRVRPQPAEAPLRGLDAAVVRGRAPRPTASSSRAGWRPTSRGSPTSTRRECRWRSPGSRASRRRRRRATCAPRGVAGGSLAIVGWEGEAERRRRRGARRARRCCAVTAARALGASPGRAWATGRFHAPYLRDDLLGRGVMVETLETATTWSNLRALYRRRRRRALARATPPFVACHISHLYPSGASLYFTFLAPQERGDEIGQWRAGQAGRVRRDRRRRRHDHPPPRDRPRPRRPPGRRGEPARHRGAARRQGDAGPGRSHEPGQAAGRVRSCFAVSLSAAAFIPGQSAPHAPTGRSCAGS